VSPSAPFRALVSAVPAGDEEVDTAPDASRVEASAVRHGTRPAVVT
jgi:hypothetical protein